MNMITVVGLADLKLPGAVATQVAAALRNDGPNDSGWVLSYDYHEQYSYNVKRIILCFRDSELFKRFGKLSREAQAACASEIVRMADSFLSNETVNPVLEFEFLWTPNRTRRLNISNYSKFWDNGKYKAGIQVSRVELKLVG